MLCIFGNWQRGAMGWVSSLGSINTCASFIRQIIKSTCNENTIVPLYLILHKHPNVWWQTNKHFREMIKTRLLTSRTLLLLCVFCRFIICFRFFTAFWPLFESIFVVLSSLPFLWNLLLSHFVVWFCNFFNALTIVVSDFLHSKLLNFEW